MSHVDFNKFPCQYICINSISILQTLNRMSVPINVLFLFQLQCSIKPVEFQECFSPCRCQGSTLMARAVRDAGYKGFSRVNTIHLLWTVVSNKSLGSQVLSNIPLFMLFISIIERF